MDKVQKAKTSFLHAVLPLVMLALVIVHATISEAALLKESIFFEVLGGGLAFGTKFCLLAFAYGHILVAIIFTVCAILLKTKMPRFIVLTFLVALLGCFLHGFWMLFWLHNPSDGAWLFLFIFNLCTIALLIGLLWIELVNFSKRSRKGNETPI